MFIENFYITRYSIGFISPAVLCLVISCTIIFRQYRMKIFTPDRVSLAVYFLGASLYNVLNFFGYSIYSSQAQIAWYLESFTPFAVLFLIRFSYYYPSPWREKERKVVIAAGALIAAAAIAEYWINSWNSPVRLFGHNYGAEYFSRAIPLVNGLFYLFGATVFLRRAAYYEKKNNSASGILEAIINPATSGAKTARTFACLIILDIIHSLIVYGGMNSFPVSIYVISFTTTIVVLLITSLYAVVYLHSAYDNIPFIYKLTGIPLILTLIIITASSYLMMNFRSESYDELNIASISRLKADAGLAENISDLNVSYIAIADNKSWRVIYDKGDTMPAAITSGLWKESPSGIQMKTGQGITGFDSITPGAKYYLQVNGINYQQYTRKIGDSIYGFGVPYLDYLHYMQKTGRLIVSVMFFSILLIIIPLTVLYHFGIISPIHRMIRSNPDGASIKHIDNELNYIERLLKNQGGRQKEKSFHGQQSGISAPIKEKIQLIEDYLKTNYHDDISREGLASMIDLDPDYISKLFKIYTGMKIGDYINRLRIEEACILLVSGDRSILDICMSVGFESLRTFNRAFIRTMGETPSSFRNKKQESSGQKQ